MNFHNNSTQNRVAGTPSDGTDSRIIHTLDSVSRPVEVIEDAFSDRIRCDHPGNIDGAKLGQALRSLAEDAGRGRIITFVQPDVAAGLRSVGYTADGRMPGFYGGDVDCVVMGMATDPERNQLANRIEVARVDELLRNPPAERVHPPVDTRRATTADSVAIAELMDATFAEYPTPSSDPAYVNDQIEQGTPFRVVESDDEIIACASADLVRQAQSAELTDCATRPDHRGRGYMQFILNDLMSDVRELGYPTVFTLARARIPGVNLAFQRLGFSLRGRMKQSCRIGDGIEDMNIWSRPIDTESLSN